MPEEDNGQQGEEHIEQEEEDDDDDFTNEEEDYEIFVYYSDESEDPAEEAEKEKEDKYEDGKAPAPPSCRKKLASHCTEDKEDSCSPLNSSQKAAEKSCSSTSQWINQTLSCIRDARHHLIDRQEMLAHPSPDSYIPYLCKVRSAALALLSCADDAISCAYAQAVKEKATLKQELASVHKKLKTSEDQYRLKSDLLQDARVTLKNQKLDFQREKVRLESSHNEEKTALLATQQILECSHNEEKTALLARQKALERELEEEKDKSICCVCHEKPRDTVILPCLHFQYCFGCLLRHRDVNSNTCPSCRGPIQGLSMSSFLAGQ